MNKQVFIIIFSLFIFTACENKKNYKYVEIVDEESLLGSIDRKEKDAQIINEQSDSSAYLAAFQKFCISIKVNRDMQTSIGKVYSTPKDFKLYDDKGNEISNMSFANKDVREKEIQERIFSLRNSIQESIDKNKKEKQESFSKSVNIDSAKVKQLEKLFRIKKDEFSNENKKWYKPKSAPIYTNANGIYCYFQTENGMPSNLRFRLQYYNDDWLFFSRIQFSIDGKAYEYVPLNTETDSGDGGYIWEWFDESVSESDKELINALANAKSAKMKLIGRQYYDTRTISPSQLNGIKQTLELYKALGGRF
ncbi:MAG: hypothetical protein HYI21_00025 [Sediminibacterium sp. Gen4]|jgi:hypothetical protein|uniref:hypothetical protein n=1 Tax=unclassified Sediminibacterium TaxID=2635961 RepID=UPI0015C18BB0|nr:MULTISPECIES: hypothetical protein [unclassified Sediminibacterium]MBW0164938.1 hypothetical protein [Sediminibacterium sp.]NWK64393.1 hypothetical protein [Sediminibacterium sp. Gen4]